MHWRACAAIRTRSGGSRHERHLRPVRYLGGHWNDDFYFSSPLHFLPGLGEGWAARRAAPEVRAAGDRLGALEIPVNPGGSRRFWAPGHPNRVDDWGAGVDHDWPTWLRMLPQYLNEFS